MGNSNIKGRSSATYNNKVNKIKKWHAEREEFRAKWDEKKQANFLPLKPLEWYVDQIKKATPK